MDRSSPDADEREPWLAPGEAAPTALASDPVFEPPLVEACRNPLDTEPDTRVPYSDAELCAAHREAVAFAKKRRANEQGAQAFADWCLERLPGGATPEWWLLWKAFTVGPSAPEDTDDRGFRLQKRRKEAFNVAFRLGFREHADEIAAGVVQMFFERGEQPVRFAVIDYLRANGFAQKSGVGMLEPVLLRGANEEQEASHFRKVVDPNSGYEEIATELRGVLDKLPRHDRSLLLLRFRWALSQRELGDLLGVTESRVCQMLGEALRRAKRATARRQKPVDLQPLVLKARRLEGAYMSELNPEPKVEIPPFTPVIEDAVPLTVARTRETRPEIKFVLDNLKPGQSVALPTPLAKLLAGKVKKLPDWKIAQRKGIAEGTMRTWRLEV